MTKNQIEYLKAKNQHDYNIASLAIEQGKLGETQRSNLANERLTRERDQRTAGLRGAELRETATHNRNTERETNRSNLAKEAEDVRHNMVGEALQNRSISENIKHNRITEGETHRANVAYEAELRRSNVARETETNRANMASEAIKQDLNDIYDRKNDITTQQLEETIRHNMVQEGFTQDQIDLAIRELRFKYHELGVDTGEFLIGEASDILQSIIRSVSNK